MAKINVLYLFTFIEMTYYHFFRYQTKILFKDCLSILAHSYSTMRQEALAALLCCMNVPKFKLEFLRFSSSSPYSFKQGFFITNMVVFSWNL